MVELTQSSLTPLLDLRVGITNSDPELDTGQREVTVLTFVKKRTAWTACASSRRSRR